MYSTNFIVSWELVCEPGPFSREEERAIAYRNVAHTPGEEESYDNEIMMLEFNKFNALKGGI